MDTETLLSVLSAILGLLGVVASFLTTFNEALHKSSMKIKVGDRSFKVTGLDSQNLEKLIADIKNRKESDANQPTDNDNAKGH